MFVVYFACARMVQAFTSHSQSLKQCAFICFSTIAFLVHSMINKENRQKLIFSCYWMRAKACICWLKNTTVVVTICYFCLDNQIQWRLSLTLKCSAYETITWFKTINLLTFCSSKNEFYNTSSTVYFVLGILIDLIFKDFIVNSM